MPPARREDRHELRQQFLHLQRTYRETLPIIARRHRDASELHAMAVWALRVGPSGWALVRQGSLKITNRAFDVLERGCVIGPRWQLLGPGQWSPLDDDAGQTLSAIVVAEAARMVHEKQTTTRLRAIRGHQVVELTLDRSRVAPSTDEMVLCIVRDITELARSEMQLAAMQARLIEKERAGLAGGVAVRVAHDLGNLVGALSGYVMAVRAGSVPDAETVDALGSICDAQMALVSKLRALGDGTREHPEPLRLAEDVVQPALRMVDVWLKGDASGHPNVRARIDPSVSGVPPVHGLRDDLINVLINLVVNARDAMPAGGTVVIGANTTEGSVVLWVEDEGTGIPNSQLERIFEPFYSSKGKGGMGMGLAMARQTMRRLGGDIRACNREGGGARFELTFPLSSSGTKNEGGDAGRREGNGA